jgi:pimeloyl-ACP methyl ester carboxylesterase/cation transport regulator ChaC
MPVPIRDDGTPGPTRRAIVFVHGFRSSEATWQPLLTLLEQDPSVTADFDFHTFSYETAAGAMPVVRRLPTLDEAGKSLAATLEDTLAGPDGKDRYIDMTVVGHSMGGLIIQSALLELLKPSGSTRTLEHVRQVILFATPNFGSTTLGRLRSLVSRFVSNPQEKALRLFSADGMRIHDAIRDRVVFARRRSRDEYPIPFYCFWGRTDDIVIQESALGHHTAGEPLPGDHFTVHCPASRSVPNYSHFVDAVRYPHGHTNIWELDRFTMTVKVEPVPPGSQVVAQHGGKQRTVVHDNVAVVTRSVVFSRHNRCREPYALKYGTRNGGWIVPRISEPHITPAEKLRLYDDNGMDAYYEVEPKPGTTASLDLTVYKGFDRGHRDFHMHLGRQSVFRRVCFEVDLSAYRAAGWDIAAPRLYFHPVDSGDHTLCLKREKINPDPPKEVDASGFWKWELEFVTEGVVDIVFDVTPAARTETLPRTIQLQPDEHAVFAYGSLLSIASLERTLGRSYRGPFVVCAIEGWRRRWNVAMPNETFAYRDTNGWITPQQIFYLNVEPRPGERVTGILFVVNADDLKRFDRREWIYDRVDVTTMLRGVTIEGGAAWVYCGKPEYVSEFPATRQLGAIRRTYLDILADGHQALGLDFIRAYENSTDPVPQSLIIDDVRRDDVVGT